MEQFIMTDKTEVHFYKCSECFYLHSSEKQLNDSVVCPECSGNLVEV